MSIPSNVGIGTGAAQVYGQDKTYEAMKDVVGKNVAIAEYQSKLAQQKKKDEEDAKVKNITAINELKSKYDVDYKGLKPADVEVTTREVNNFFKGKEGIWEKVNNGDPDASNKVREEWNLIKANVNKRIENYSNLKSIGDDIQKDPTKFSSRQIDLYKNIYDTPNVNSADYIEEFAQEVNPGDPINEHFVKNKSVLIKPEFSSITDGGTKSVTGTMLRDYDEGFVEYKNTWTSPDEYRKVILVYKDDKDVEKDDKGHPTANGIETILEKAYKVERSKITESKSTVNTTPQEKDGDGSGGKKIPTYVTITQGKKTLSTPNGVKSAGRVTYSNGSIEDVDGSFNNFRTNQDGTVSATLTVVEKTYDPKTQRITDRNKVTENVMLDGNLINNIGASLNINQPLRDYIKSKPVSSEIVKVSKKYTKEQLENRASELKNPDGKPFTEEQKKRYVSESLKKQNEYGAENKNTNIKGNVR